MKKYLFIAILTLVAIFISKCNEEEITNSNTNPNIKNKLQKPIDKIKEHEKKN